MDLRIVRPGVPPAVRPGRPAKPAPRSGESRAVKALFFAISTLVLAIFIVMVALIVHGAIQLYRGGPEAIGEFGGRVVSGYVRVMRGGEQ